MLSLDGLTGTLDIIFFYQQDQSGQKIEGFW
jgi:hypothetical protein